ncbi:unnamed protein product [Protopolystoma xenopodis]|uniref:Uncharacterized protein n=1 Tax=Protopolystoma xenopodis TaxID=117903 RepID=A0A3S4ZMA3_9PLAT|nr:unnamed protein product [Protopolystoma xenopodis]
MARMLSCSEEVFYMAVNIASHSTNDCFGQFGLNFWNDDMEGFSTRLSELNVPPILHHGQRQSQALAVAVWLVDIPLEVGTAEESTRNRESRVLIQPFMLDVADESRSLGRPLTVN